MRRLILLCVCVLLPMQALSLDFTLGSTATTVSGYLEGLGVYALDQDTPTEDPSALFSLSAKADLAKWGAFKLTLKGGYDGKIRDPESGKYFTDMDKIYQNRNPFLSVDEAYLDLFTGKADFRIGIQKFAWGRLDEVNPTDNLNTEDMTDPVLQDESERKLGVPAVKANIYSDIVNCELAWIPRFVPYRLSQPNERWFPPIFVVPSSIETNTGFGAIPVEAEYEEIDLPPLRLENSEAGVRFSKSVTGWELSASYFTGYDPMPVMTIPTELTIVLTDPDGFQTDVQAKLTARPELHRMHVFGADFSTTLGGFTVRGEGAYFHGKYYVRTVESIYAEMLTAELQQQIMEQFLDRYTADNEQTRQTFSMYPPIALKYDALKYGLGIDYVRGDATISMQIIEEHVLDYDKDKPIYFIDNGYDTMITLAYKQFFLQNTLELTLAGVYDYTFKHYLIQPSLVYSFTDAIKGTLGAVIINGKYDDSLLGQFKNNDEIFGKLRYSF